MKKSQFSVRRYEVSPTYFTEQREHFNELVYYPKVVYKNASRYKNLRTLMDDNGKIYHESWNQRSIDGSAEDQYYIVTKTEEDRLDMVSLRFYDTPRYWWVIAMANNIIDPFNIEVGLQLRIPPLISLYNRGGILGG